MSVHTRSPQYGAKAIALDHRAQLVKIRFLFFLSLMCSATLAQVLHMVLSR